MRIVNIISFAIAGVSSLLLCQCANNRVPKLKPGQAYLDASPSEKHRAELSGFRVVSVNGKKTRGSATAIPSGPVKTVVAFHWPRIGKKRVPLSFTAREGHAYFVKYDRFPYPGKSSAGLKGVTKGLIATGAKLHMLGLPFIGAGVLTGFVEDVRKNSGITTRTRHAVNYIDLYIISRLSSEGVVRQVRAYPNGKLEKR